MNPATSAYPTDQNFGRLTPIALFEDEQVKPIRWLCLCECGTVREYKANNLKTGNTKSCGCLHSERVTARNYVHGLSDSRTYITWAHIKARCFDLNCVQYKYYGGRGITVCKRWENSFENFLADMGEKPSQEHSIERINNDGNYEPSNCAWILRSEQSKNRRNPIPRTHCLRGHEFTDANTYLRTENGKPYRTCRTCMKAKAKNEV